MGPDVRVGFLERMALELRNGRQKSVLGGDIQKMQGRVQPRNKKEYSLFNGLRDTKNTWTSW